MTWAFAPLHVSTDFYRAWGLLCHARVTVGRLDEVVWSSRRLGRTELFSAHPRRIAWPRPDPQRRPGPCSCARLVCHDLVLVGRLRPRGGRPCWGRRHQILAGPGGADPRPLTVPQPRLDRQRHRARPLLPLGCPRAARRRARRLFGARRGAAVLWGPRDKVLDDGPVDVFEEPTTESTKPGDFPPAFRCTPMSVRSRSRYRRMSLRSGSSRRSRSSEGVTARRTTAARMPRPGLDDERAGHVRTDLTEQPSHPRLGASVLRCRHIDRGGDLPGTHVCHEVIGPTASGTRRVPSRVPWLQSCSVSCAALVRGSCWDRGRTCCTSVPISEPRRSAANRMS